VSHFGYCSCAVVELLLCDILLQSGFFVHIFGFLLQVQDKFVAWYANCHNKAFELVCSVLVVSEFHGWQVVLHQ